MLVLPLECLSPLTFTLLSQLGILLSCFLSGGFGLLRKLYKSEKGAQKKKEKLYLRKIYFCSPTKDRVRW